MIRHHRQYLLWSTARILGDLACGLLAMLAAFLTRVYVEIPLTLSRLPEDRLRYLMVAWLLVLATQNGVLYFLGLYGPPRAHRALSSLRPLFAASLTQALLYTGYFFFADQTFPRSVLLLFIPINVGLLFVWRMGAQQLIRTQHRRVAIVGANAEAQEVARNIHREAWMGLQVMGYVLAPHQEEETPDPSLTSGMGPCLGRVADLPRLLEEGVIEDVILVDDTTSWQTLLIDRLAHLGKARGSVLVLPSPYESLIGRTRFRSIQDIPLIELVRENEWHINRPLKRLFDLLLGSLLLLLALPLIAICGVAIRLTSPGGPIFYRQTRVGQNRQPFTLWKLRTMKPDAEAENREQLAQLDDPRLIPIGGILRRARLDELPQLLNVLDGSMSLVGPRPERPGFVSTYLDRIPGYAERFSIPPGVTGLAQINGHYHSSAQTKLRYDLAYLANWSMWLDITILMRTVRIVLTSQGT